MQYEPLNTYDQFIVQEMKEWAERMQRRPSLTDRLSKRVQERINRIIPERIHKAITGAIREMVKGVLFGAQFTNGQPVQGLSIHEVEDRVRERIEFYKRTAAVEGGITGAGGILLGLADFPLLLGIKIKMLFEIAALYGYDTRDLRERVYLLHIFQLAFSSQTRRREIFWMMRNWEKEAAEMPTDIDQFDWRRFQQEYRDYIDLAKLAQLMPGIGAAVGLVVNYRLLRQLGNTAMNAYRMRLLPART